MINLNNFNNIPPPLRERGYFCCWRYEERGGKETKIPYNPANGQRAQTNNPHTFTDFKTALQMANEYDGIGFLITDDIFVIDCDHCRNGEDVLTSTVSEIVNMFPENYMEWSPYVNGLHIIGYAPNFRFDREKTG